MGVQTSLATTISTEDRRAGKYLTFFLGNEEFGLEILKVREIIGIMKTTAVPQMPAFMNGVINLRGKVIPVVDLRLRFGMPSAEQTSETCIIVVDVRGDLMGIIVDRVSEVQEIRSEAIEDPPNVGTNVDMSFILGMGKIEDNVKILLDIGKVLSDAEHTEVMDATSSSETQE
jgi:purine-binding chemotaxis protein CheW